MHIAVLMKQVPDTDEVKMDPERGTMIRDGVDGIVNPLDLHALEAALMLRGEGDDIVLLSMGPPQAGDSLREGLALGADRAILATDRAFAGGDSWATSKVLAAMLRRIGMPDIILAGEKATDGETGQVGPEVAAMLDIPVVTHVTGIENSPSGLKVKCTLEEGLLIQEVQTPCLLTVLSNLNDLSMPTLAGKKRAISLTIETLTAFDLDLDENEIGLRGSPTRVVRIAQPKIARNAEKFSARQRQELEAGIERIVDILEELAVI